MHHIINFTFILFLLNTTSFAGDHRSAIGAVAGTANSGSAAAAAAERANDPRFWWKKALSQISKNETFTGYSPAQIGNVRKTTKASALAKELRTQARWKNPRATLQLHSRPDATVPKGTNLKMYVERYGSGKNGKFTVKLTISGENFIAVVTLPDEQSKLQHLTTSRIAELGKSNDWKGLLAGLDRYTSMMPNTPAQDTPHGKKTWGEWKFQFKQDSRRENPRQKPY